MKNLIPRTKLFLKRNSSTILTCMGAVGVIATALSAIKETPKAMRIIEEREKEKGDKLTKFETFKVAAPVYIPSMVLCGSTLACIFGSNILNKKQQASLMSAYALINNSYKQYRDTTKEVCGEETHNKIMQAITQLHYDDNDLILKEDKKMLFFDFYSLQQFYAKVDDVMAAEEKVNELFETRGFVSIGEFYDMIPGVVGADVDYYLGWSKNMGHYLYGYNKVEFNHKPIFLDDGTECCVITYTFEPTTDYMN